MTEIQMPVGRALQGQITTLTEFGVIPGVFPVLKATSERAAAALRAAALGEIPSFTASANPTILPALVQHIGEHVDELMRLMAGGAPSDFDFVRRHVTQRAEERFPLEVTLHAYRLGHRVLSQWMRDAAAATVHGQLDQAISAIADFSIDYTNAISIVAATEYVARARAIAEADVDQRTELLNILLAGYDESDSRVARLLRRAGYLEQRRSYCVAVSQATKITEMEHPERVQRIASAIIEAFAGTSVRVLTGIRNNMLVAVLSDLRRQSGWTAPLSRLSTRANPALQMLGPAVLVGLSGDHPSTAFVPRAYQEAMTAFDFASISARVVAFADLPIRSLLLHRGADQVRATPPAWVASFLAASAEDRGTWIATLRAIADADLNIQRAARRLGKHPNTLYFRLRRIREETGLDAQHHNDLNELLFAADCWKL